MSSALRQTNKQDRASQNGKAASFITPEDIYLIRQVKECKLAPDDSFAVLTVQFTPKGGSGNYTNLYLLQLADELQPHGIASKIIGPRAVRQITFGNYHDKDVKISPDSSLIAFRSNRGDGIQVHLIAPDGGASWQLTNFDGTVYGYDWSPDSKQMVIAMRPPDETQKWLRENNRQEVDWRWVDKLEFKLNASGVKSESFIDLYAFDVAKAKAKLILSDGTDNESPVFTPDGEQVVFISNKAKDPDYDFLKLHLWRMPFAGGKPQRIDQGIPGCASDPAVSPDGKLVAFRWRPPTNSELGWEQTRMYVVPLEGGEPTQLGKELDRPIDIEVHNDTWTSPQPCPPKWSADCRYVYSVVTSLGIALPYKLSVDGKEAVRLIDDEGVTLFWDLHKDEQRICYSLGLREEPGELFSQQVGGGKREQLSDFNPWLRERETGHLVTTWAKADGYDIQGWILHPPDFDPAQKYPAVHYVHGGPHSAYAEAYMHQYQCLAARGYVVFYANITGSTGYGEDFKRPMKERWAGRDWDDVLTFLDHVLRECSYIDRSRVAIAGGSYGGYMVNWALGHTDRYACAVSERGVSNMVSHQADGDTVTLHTGFGLPMEEHAFKHHERFWEMSPMKYIGSAKTPTLVICAEEDLRVPTSQLDQLYTALKLQRVEVKMLRFPEADHTFYTDGNPKQRIYWMNAIADWLDEHLK